MGGDVTMELTFTPHAGGRRIIRPVMGVVVNHITQGAVGGVNMRMTGFEARLDHDEREPVTLRCTLQRPPLLQGRYTLDLWLGDGSEDVDSVAGYLQFDVEAADIYGSGRMPFTHMGSIYLQPQWEALSSASAVLVTK
jgi:hypothetical protein